MDREREIDLFVILLEIFFQFTLQAPACAGRSSLAAIHGGDRREREREREGKVGREDEGLEEEEGQSWQIGIPSYIGVW